MSLNAIDLSRIPAPDALVVVDHAAKVAEMKTALIAIRPDLAPSLDLASEPLVKLIEVWAYESILKANEINAGVRAMLLPLASGGDLDNIVSNLRVQRLSGESDAALRQRAALAPEGWATAGPLGAYRFHALGASPDVADVAISSPSEGRIRVVVLSKAANGVATPALLATVSAALNDEEVRPLSDAVSVVSAGVAGYDVVATLKMPSGPDAGPVAALAEAAIRAYAAERRKLNRGLPLNGVRAALMQPGVEDLVLTQPAADIAPQAEIAPVLGAVTLTIEVMP